MDPLTAALQLANTLAQIYLVGLQAQSPEQRAEFARMQLEDMKAWRAVFTQFRVGG